MRFLEFFSNFSFVLKLQRIITYFFSIKLLFLYYIPQRFFLSTKPTLLFLEIKKNHFRAGKNIDF